MLVIEDHCDGRVPVYEEKENKVRLYEFEKWETSYSSRDHLPINWFEYSSRVVMLVIADHSGGRVPVYEGKVDMERICVWEAITDNANMIISLIILRVREEDHEGMSKGTEN